jgi:hypothetical protein
MSWRYNVALTIRLQGKISRRAIWVFPNRRNLRVAEFISGFGVAEMTVIVEGTPIFYPAFMPAPQNSHRIFMPPVVALQLVKPRGERPCWILSISCLGSACSG